MTRPPAVIAGRFAVEREAGAGGMATVYRARDLTTGEIVALKQLDSVGAKDSERFSQEAAILADLAHPAIVRYVDHGVTVDGRPYLAMEWLEGEDLASRLELGALTPGEAVDAIRRVAGALSVAHARGVIHRDIKPENLFLPDGQLERIKVLDFGIARLTGAGRRLTMTGTLMGTPGYLAPEIIGGARDANPRWDIFALGCVAFHCLTGRAPFEADNLAAILTQALLANVERVDRLVPDVPAALADLVAAMLARAPDDRPADAQAVIKALDACVISEARPALQRSRGGSPRLTINEQRIVSVVAARLVDGAAPDATALDAVRDAGATPHGLSDGTFLFGLPQARTATDNATGGARIALLLLGRYPTAAIAVCTGPGRLDDGVPAGEVVEGAAELLAVTPAGVIGLDDMGAALLDGRFEIQRADSGRGPYLRAPRAGFEGRRKLLGRSAAFVGRARELGLLTNTFLAATGEEIACGVLIIAAAGTGKSRLRQEFLDWVAVRSEPVEVLFAAGDSVGTGSPFALLGQALRRAAGIDDGDGAEERRRKLAVRVGRNVAQSDVARLVAFLGELAGVPFPDAHEPTLRSARQDPQLMGDSLRRAWEDWLAAECRAHPVILVLDDLQWSDAGTIGLIDATLRRAREAPLMIVASARPEVEKAFPNLWAGREVQTLRLGPLSRKAGEILVRDALGAALPATVVADLVERSDGNPFYLEELIRATHEGRQEGLPDSVLGMVQARLDAEPTEARQVLRAASVFGERFSAAGVTTLLGGVGQTEEVAGWLRHLTARELIRPAPTPGGGGADSADVDWNVFTHALIRESAYAMLTPHDQTLGHRLAGHWLAETQFPDPMVVAEHLRRGGQPERAVTWYDRAAAHALGANHLEAAIRRAELGLQALAAASPDAAGTGTRSEAAGQLRLIQAEAHLWRGEHVLAEGAAAQATRDLGPGSAGWLRAAAHTIVALGRQGRLDEMDGWVALVTGVLPAPGARTALTISLAWASTFMVFGGRYQAADELMDAVADLAGAGPDADPLVMALLHQARSARASTRGDLGACLASMEAALAAFERAGDERNACTARANVAFVFAELGDAHRAEQVLRDALASAERMGLADVCAIILHNLGRVVGLTGDLVEAERLERSALEQLERQGEPRLQGLTRAYLAAILTAAHKLPEAVGQARLAVITLDGIPGLRAVAATTLASALAASGRMAEALEAARRAQAELDTLGTIEEGEAEIRLGYAICLAAVGEAVQARAAIESARTHLLARAEHIADPVWRARFLNDVAANARTLALADRWDEMAPSPTPPSPSWCP